MGRTKLKLTSQTETNPIITNDREIFNDITINDFFELHNKFMEFKALECLAPRSLEDHKTHINYFKKYLETEHRITPVRCVDIDLLRGYIHYMVYEKQYKPCTINIRLRNLKTFLKWLYNENHIDMNFSTKLKLVKEPKDTIRPLSDNDVKKMLKAPNKKTYSGYRDFCLMLLMLDCGIRVTEAINLEVEDIDLKLGLINIKAGNAKTRTFRQVPISNKTCKFLKELINVSKENDCTYLFQSSFGGKISRNQIVHNFENYGKSSGVECRCTPHVFRHVFATNFIKASGDIFVLQRILGHSTLAMCRKYIQLDNSDLIKKHSETKLLDKYIR